MPTIKTRSDQPSSMEARIVKRGQNSGGQRADVTVKNDGPGWRYHNVHFAANQAKPRDVRKDKA